MKRKTYYSIMTWTGVPQIVKTPKAQGGLEFNEAKDYAIRVAGDKISDALEQLNYEMSVLSEAKQLLKKIKLLTEP